MKKYINKLLLIVLTVFSLLFWDCSKEKWDKHYDATAGQNNVKNVVNSLRQKGYNEFATALERCSLDSSINSGMQFTIFAVTDDAFRQATSNLSGYDLEFFVLNHMLAGKHYTSEFKNGKYRALAGSILYINSDSVSNFFNKWVKFINKDMDIQNAVVIELAHPINILPDLYHDFSAYYPFFYSFYKEAFLPNTVQYPLILGVTSSGLTIDSEYRYNKFFTLTQTSNYLSFVVSRDNYAINTYNQQVTDLLPYFIGGEDVIKSDIENNTKMKHVIVSSSYNTGKDSLILNNLASDKYRLPVSKVDQVICDNGNKLLVIDTLLYYYPIRKNKIIDLSKYLVTSITGTKGAFKNVSVTASSGDALVNWTSAPQTGDYIECSFPADSIYTKHYDLRLEYGWKTSYVKVKIYVDGDSLQNRFDLGSNTSPATRVGTTGTNYRYVIALDNLIKKYQMHTIRFEVVGIKGAYIEIMNLRKLTLNLTD